MKICLKCKSTFASYAKINGVRKNLGNRKYCLDCSPHGARNRRKLHILEFESEKKCPRCNQVLSIENFKTKVGKIRCWCLKCVNDEAMGRQRALKQKAIAYKGGECKICGYDKCASAMEFHHVDDQKKDFSISQQRSTLFENIKSELDKCVLLCSNCHREIHSGITAML